MLQHDSSSSKRRFFIVILARTIQIAQVAVPSQAHNVDDQYSQLKRHILEVDKLHDRPNHPVSRQRRPVCALQFLRCACTLQKSHCVKEEEEIAWCEDGLIETDTSEDFGIGTTREDYASLEETKPGCCERTEDCYYRSKRLAECMSQHNVSTVMAEESKVYVGSLDVPPP